MATPTEYTHPKPFDTGFLSVGSIHQIYYEQSGNKGGKPVIFLHGGPGGHISRASTAFFNPDIYRVVLFDQRGAGKSRPVAELRENTTQLLIDDIETIRKHVRVDKWHMVFGGSWGSTLGLAYAQAHPEAVGSLVLRGILTGEMWEFDHLYRGKTSKLFFPNEYWEWLHYLPEKDRDDPMMAYVKLLKEGDRETRLAAGRVWNRFEMTLSSLVPNPKLPELLADDDFVLQHSMIEAHYFSNACFLQPGQLMKEENLERIRHIPTALVNGRYDVLCVPLVAVKLHKALPNSTLHITPDAGHSVNDAGTKRKLIEICDEYAQKDLV